MDLLIKDENRKMSLILKTTFATLFICFPVIYRYWKQTPWCHPPLAETEIIWATLRLRLRICFAAKNNKCKHWSRNFYDKIFSAFRQLILQDLRGSGYEDISYFLSASEYGRKESQFSIFQNFVWEIQFPAASWWWERSQ